MLAIPLFFIAGCILVVGIFFSTKKKDVSTTTPHPPFKEWIVGSGYEHLPENEQYDLYIYSRVIHRAAEEKSTDVLPNPDAYHAAIVIAIIIATAKTVVVMRANCQSHEILEHPLCLRAIAKAKTRGVNILYLLHPSNTFVAVNDNGMQRRENCSSAHSAQVSF